MRRKRAKKFVVYTVKTLYRNACAKNGLLNFVLVISRSERPVEIDSDKINALVDGDHLCTIRDVAEIPNASRSSVENHLNALGYVSKLDVWTPRQISKKFICLNALLRAITFETRGKRSVSETRDNRR